MTILSWSTKPVSWFWLPFQRFSKKWLWVLNLLSVLDYNNMYLRNSSVVFGSLKVLTHSFLSFFPSYREWGTETYLVGMYFGRLLTCLRNLFIHHRWNLSYSRRTVPVVVNTSTRFVGTLVVCRPFPFVLDLSLFVSSTMNH